MGLDDDDLLVKALDGVGFKAVPDLLILTDDQIDNLTYMDPDTGDELLPPLPSRNKLRILRSWNFHLQQVQGRRRVDWMDINTVNEDEWDDYRVSIYVPPGLPTAAAPPVGPVAPTAAVAASRPSVPAFNPATEFRRGIKRDKSHYKEIKDEKQWDDFKRTTVATIHAHGCENVIDPAYVPTTPDEVVLFEEQKKFLYDVWATILKTPMGKHFVRLHENTRDVERLYELHALFDTCGYGDRGSHDQPYFDED